MNAQEQIAQVLHERWRQQAAYEGYRASDIPTWEQRSREMRGTYLQRAKEWLIDNEDILLIVAPNLVEP